MNKTALNNTKQSVNTSSSSTEKFRARPKILVYREIDELGLDPYEFRVYSHIARRKNCFARLNKIAATSRMSVRQLQYALKVLEASGLIEKEKRNGRTNKFCLAPSGRWLNSMNEKQLETIRDKVKNGEKIDCLSEKGAIAKENSGDFDPSDTTELDEGDVPY